MLTSQFCGCFSYLHLWPANLVMLVFLSALFSWWPWVNAVSSGDVHRAQSSDGSSGPVCSLCSAFLFLPLQSANTIQTFLTLLRMGFSPRFLKIHPLSKFSLNIRIWVRAAITEDHSLSDLNNKLLFLTVLKAGKSKTEVLADLVSGESPLPGSQTAVSLLCLHVVESTGELSGASYLQVTRGIRFKEMNFGATHSVYKSSSWGVKSSIPQKVPFSQLICIYLISHSRPFGKKKKKKTPLKSNPRSPVLVPASNAS